MTFPFHFYPLDKENTLNFNNIKANYSYFILFGICLIATFFRLYKLDFQDIGNDEMINFLISSLDLREIFHAILVEIHPPLYYYLLHSWMYLGNNLGTLRVLSVIFGIFTIPFVYLVGEKCYGKKVGLLSCVFISISPFYIFYSQEMRMYSLSPFLAIVCVWLFLRIIEKNEKKIWVLFIIFTVLGLYTHYSFFYLLFVENIFLVIMWLRKNYTHLCVWFISQIIILLLFLPGLYILGSQILMVHKYGSQNLVAGAYPFHFKNLLAMFYNFVFWSTFSMQIKIPLLILLIVVFFVGLGSTKWKAFRRFWSIINNDKTLFLLFYFLLPILIASILGKLVYSPLMYFPRFFIIFVPGYYIILANGIINLKPNLVKIVTFSLFFIFLTIASATLNNGRHILTRPPTRAVLEYIHKGYRYGDDLVLIHFSHLKMLFDYYNKYNFHIDGVGPSFDPKVGAWPRHFLTIDETNLLNFKKQLEGFSRMWLVLTPVINAQWRDPKNMIWNYCENNFRRIDNQIFSNTGEPKGTWFEIFLYDLHAKSKTN